MKRILDNISNSTEFGELLNALKRDNDLEQSMEHSPDISQSKNHNELKATKISGLAGSLKSVYAALLHQRLGLPVLYITEDPLDAHEIYADICSLIGEENTTLYHSEHHTNASAVVAVSKQSSHLQGIAPELMSLVDSLKTISSSNCRVIITDVESLQAQVPAPDNMHSNTTTINRGDNLGMEEFIRTLALGGFDKVEVVSSLGEYAVRGGLVDVFPLGMLNPIRIEFFGNEIDSIREFEILSQRSLREFESMEITTKIFHPDEIESLNSNLLNYLPPISLVFIEEPDRIFGLLEDQGNKQFVEELNNYTTIFHSNFYNDSVINPNAKPQEFTNSSLREINKLIDSYHKNGFKIFILSEGTDAKRRIEDLLESECDRAFSAGEEYSFQPSGLLYVQESLAQGFTLAERKIAVITEHQLFERRRSETKTNKRNKKFKGFTFRELKQLRAGDYVVHVDKGIGKFMGLETITVAGSQSEVVKLQYQGGDVLFVNMSYINRLQKYSSKEGAEPKLNKLGTGDWERTKARAKKRLKDIARELIKLYAERKRQKGFAFAYDTTWQRELEASFMYDDTEDQAKATVDIKRDMEAETPMDRLVCGDVGFGKTEVAVRAAFKAAQSGKQVAVLCPTTILAQQHYNTFRDRLNRYAVSVDLLSRFRNKQEQKNTLDKLVNGKIDVLIGTHRILSKDVVFKDIGLLVIDEEQRFGVSAKEKLRMMRANIDTLTLTATPIPRTLNFSLLGARDLSLIETPPRNRLPIHTELILWNEATLREIIIKELQRGGQCFFVHWRIGDIEEYSAKIRELVPNARITVAHGQMPPEQVEKNVMAFIEKKYDILLATKIIESGIDIPAVNTMIVNRADKYGLAELYQLRGRVGRSNIQAFCYMIVPPLHTVSKIALRRLQAIQELTDLGSGMKLAMRDLEIRGAGNLFGGEQSGFIDDIGFELYQKTIDEAVDELKREEFRDIFQDEKDEPTLPLNESITIESEQDALIVKSYIPSDSERYDYYMRMYACTNEQLITTLENEMQDRFGKMPQKTERLFDVIRLRLLAMQTGAEKIILTKNNMIIELPPKQKTEFYQKHFKLLLHSASNIPQAEITTQGSGIRIIIKDVNSLQDAYSGLLAFVDGISRGFRLGIE